MPLSLRPRDARPAAGAELRAGRVPPRRFRPAAAVGAGMIALAGAGSAPVLAQPVRSPVTYQLDPNHTFVQFEVMHFGTSTLRGRIGPLTGEVTLDRDARTGEVRLRIPVATVETGVPALDARLKEPDLLAVADYPEAYFVATRFRFDDAGGVQEVRGEFTLRGVGEPLSLVARSFACRDDATLKRQVCGGDFDGHLKRSRFGATLGLPFIGDDVHLVIQVEGIANRPMPAANGAAAR